ncbi:hypothetical protein ACFLQY_01505 [Verrucomicrobiota bacterium]
MKQLLAILFFGTVAATAASNSFQDYKVILDRRPFGEAPAVGVPSTPAVASTPSTYRLSALYEGIDGQTRAGLVNKKNNKSLVLRPDTTEDGIKLVDADLSAGTATIIERGRTYVLELAATPAPEATPAPAPEKKQTRTSRFSERRRRLLERINKKNAKKQEPEKAEPRLRGEELQKHLEEYQMEVIRRGMPALPVPLTEEMDRQLVEEGILSPVE